MMKNLSKVLFMMMMLMGTVITMSSNSWLGLWMGLEINLLSFIPLIMNTNNLNSSEAALNYFLVQAFASTIILFSMIFTMINEKVIFFMNLSMKTNFMALKLMTMTLMLKMGAAPFHFWFPNVMENITWMSCLMLMTWQKLAPMMIISYMINMNNLFLIFVIMSTFVGAIGGLNQTSMRKLLAFSSINHMGWMITAIMFNENLWFIYFTIYSMLNFSIVYLFNIFQIFYLNQMYSLFMNSYFLKFSLLTSILSLGGLPPFLGFIPKWLIIQSLLFMKLNLINMFMIYMSMITLFYYLKISFSAFMFNYSEFNFMLKNYFKPTNFMIMTMSNFISLFSFFLIIELTWINM
uniref:NADH-ubiquinone oxidoreductase chain 2 n=1 Tax=Bradysia sp. XQM-2020 TaxID=2715249 RepID=A0A6G7GC78_9DIPT|nr:NADH dehydrogenase subunit 2 [Bradysia sp. XQM-2020]